MAEEEPRVQKVLAYLESIKEYGLVRPKTIGEAIGETAEIVGQDLYSLKERGLVVAEEEGLWKITPEGTEQVIERQHKEKGKQKAKAKPKPEAKGGPSAGETRTEQKTEQKPEQIGKTVTIPTQVEILRSIGESLGVGAKKGEVRLDAIIYYVQRTALCFLYSLV